MDVSSEMHVFMLVILHFYLGTGDFSFEQLLSGAAETLDFENIKLVMSSQHLPNSFEISAPLCQKASVLFQLIPLQAVNISFYPSPTSNYL